MIPKIRVSRDGVTKYCEDLLLEIDPHVKTVADGVFRLEVSGTEVFTCLIDFLSDGMYWSQSWAALNPACYIAVNPHHARFGEENWLTKVSLAELVCDEAQLRDILQSVAARGRPREVPRASVALFGKGPGHTVMEPERSSPPSHSFIVEVGSNIVLVDGTTVIPANARPRYIVFRTLWQWFLDDLRDGLPPEHFRAWTIDKIAEELMAQTGKAYPDEGNIRRIINNLQAGTADTLKRKNGTPIDREDIVQSCRDGYRINPFTVVVRPFQGDLS